MYVCFVICISYLSMHHTYNMCVKYCINSI